MFSDARVFLIIALLLGGIGVGTARAQVGIDQPIGAVRGWDIGLSDTTGGCLATTSYTDGTNVFVGFSGNGTPYLAFTNRGWGNIRPDRSYDVSLVMPGYGSWSGKFIGFDQMDGKGLLGVSVKAEFIAALMGARGVTLYLGRRRIAALSLSGSSAAMQKVIECQKVEPVRTRNREASPPAAREQPGGGSGTGFFVSARGHVLTNYHVAGRCDRLTVRTDEGVQLNANLVASDATNDLALLATGRERAGPAAFSKSVRLGSSVFVFGYPLSGLLASSGNFTSGSVTALAGINDNSTMLQFSAPVQPGNSGGALLNDQGTVVGVIKAKLDALSLAGATSDIAQNVNFAIKSSVVLNFLEAANIEPSFSGIGSPLAPADIADRAKQFSAQVVCEVGPGAPSNVAPQTTTNDELQTGVRLEVGKSFMTAGYRPAGATTRDECALVCRREDRCLAFQFSNQPIYDHRVHRQVQCRLYDDARNLDTVSSEGNTVGFRADSATAKNSTAPGTENAREFSEHRSRAMEGGDLKVLRGETENGCKSACGQDGRCSGYSYDVWNKYCFLKAELGEFRRDPRYLTAISGGSRIPEMSTPHSIRKRSNKFFPGASYLATDVRSFEECGERCLADYRCDAISYGRQSKRCSLYSEPSEYFDRTGSDIGLRLQEP